MKSIDITPTVAARILGCHRSTVYRLVMHGKLPARRVCGCRYLLPRAAVEAFAKGIPVVPAARSSWAKPEGGAS